MSLVEAALHLASITAGQDLDLVDTPITLPVLPHALQLSTPIACDARVERAYRRLLNIYMCNLGSVCTVSLYRN